MCVCVVGFMKIVNVDGVGVFLGLDVVSVVVGMWGMYGKGLKLLGG